MQFLFVTASFYATINTGSYSQNEWCLITEPIVRYFQYFTYKIQFFNRVQLAISEKPLKRNKTLKFNRKQQQKIQLLGNFKKNMVVYLLLTVLTKKIDILCGGSKKMGPRISYV